MHLKLVTDDIVWKFIPISHQPFSFWDSRPKPLIVMFHIYWSHHILVWKSLFNIRTLSLYLWRKNSMATDSVWNYRRDRWMQMLLLSICNKMWWLNWNNDNFSFTIEPICIIFWICRKTFIWKHENRCVHLKTTFWKFGIVV